MASDMAVADGVCCRLPSCDICGFAWVVVAKGTGVFCPLGTVLLPRAKGVENSFGKEGTIASAFALLLFDGPLARHRVADAVPLIPLSVP